MKNYLLGCDWGTSSFRLRLINLDDHQILGEVVSREGIAHTYNSWKQESENKGVTRRNFFCQQLKRQIDILSGQVAFCLDHLSIVVSGMASSSIGMEEIPYAALPFALDGSQAGVVCIEKQEDFCHEVILISGVKSPEDVMRGEETQLIGLMSLLELEPYRSGKAVLLFPGTHSKHVYIHDGQLVSFQTYMTGEVFNLMSNYSILKDSVEVQSFTDSTSPDWEAFQQGVAQAVSSNILHGLFTVRTNQLFHKLNKKQNEFYLSGLLIGTELKDLLKADNGPIILCCGKHLFEFYKLALEALPIANHTITLTADLIDQATIAGQIKIFQHQKKEI